MIHWHSLLTQRSPQQGAFPGKTSGPLFVDATLLIQPAAWFREHHGKAGKLARDMWAMLASDSTVQACPGISNICCITAPRRGCRSKLRMFFSVLTCAIHSRTARVKNVAQISGYTVHPLPALPIWIPVVKTGSPPSASYILRCG